MGRREAVADELAKPYSPVVAEEAPAKGKAPRKY